MIPFIEWNENERREVQSLEALNQLIDQLDHKGRETKPFMIVLQVNPETGLGIVVGCEASHVNFYGAEQCPLVVGCTGPWDDDTGIVYYYYGQYSEMPRRYCVPLADAKEAMRQYFQTGKRPQNLKWNKWT